MKFRKFSAALNCRWVLTVGVLCVMFLCDSGRSAELPELQFPLTLGMQIKAEYDSPEVFASIRKLGFRYVRRGFYWKSTEVEKGKYDFAPYDRVMADADKQGMGVIAVLYGNPNSTFHENNGQGGVQTDGGRKGFAAFAGAMAKHFKGKNIIWEIWNEPNTQTFWRKTGKGNTAEFADEYTSLVKAVMPAMLKADPDCFVIAGSLSNYWEPSYQWTEYCFQKGILKTGIKGWSVHPYGVKTPEEHLIGHQRIRDLLKKHDAPAGLDILNTERGFSVKKTEEGWSGGSEEKAREFQAWHFVRQCLIDALAGVRLTVWYEWKGDKFNLVDSAGQKTPAYVACEVMMKLLSGYAFKERLQTESEQDYLLRLSNKEGREILVVWTAPKPATAPDTFVAHSVDIPVSASGVCKIYDINGKTSEAVPVGGKLSIALSGSPQYIELPANSN